jgi:hypothetical protein
MLNRMRCIVKRAIKYRKFHIYCVGTAKSGTHSIAHMFDNKLCVGHEPEGDELLDVVFDTLAGSLSETELNRYLLARDRRLWLEVDSSQLNYFFLVGLVELFPDAKFILTIRDPYSWLDSFLNHQLARGGGPKWVKLRDIRFQPDVYVHQQGEQILKEKGLYTLDGYFSYWARHNHTVLETVPEDRLLVVRTDMISDRVDDIAAFAGVETNDIQRERTHAFKAKEKFGLLDRLDQQYLESKVNQYCADLVARFFPEIQSGRSAPHAAETNV